MIAPLRAALAAAFLLALCVACGSSSATPAPATTTATAAPSAAPTSATAACTTDATEGEEVAISGFQFQPAEVTITAGTAVAWTNNDSDAHTVTFSDGPDCGTLQQGDATALTFDTAGTFAYVCSFHPNMRGTVVVE